jgi:K+-transporting ATPase ATPase C chain
MKITMRKILMISLRYTIATTLLLGLGYPLLVTVIAQHLWKNKANGELIVQNGRMIGSHWIGQPFTGPMYFHSRPSAAGAGYDAASSGGSNLSPTNKHFVGRVESDVEMEQDESPLQPVPIDLVTASASGLDPDITPASAEYQARRIAQARGLQLQQVEALIQRNLTERQFGLLGERRVNVLQLNMELNALQTGTFSKK